MPPLHTPHVTTPSAPPTVRPGGDPLTDSRLAEILAVLPHAFPNLLLIGDDASLDAAFRRLQPSLRTPIALWVPGITSTIPATCFNTLIVRDIGRLDAGQQSCLSQLVAEVLDVQVVALTGAPLFPLVEAGVFLEELYYRLNVLMVDLSAR